MRTPVVCVSLLALATACRTGTKTETDTGGVGGTAGSLDADGDGFFASEDCDDNDASVNPAGTEVCDGIDNDCDAEIDEGVTSTFYADADGDSFGDPDTAVEACAAPEGFVDTGTDCDDQADTTWPGANELCDGIDNDCDTDIDEGVTSTFYTDADGDGFGEAAVEACSQPPGTAETGGDCDDTSADVFPGNPEVCDELDNDCDAEVDEGVTLTFYSDTDADGHGDPDATIEACSAPVGYAATGDDCDDDDGSRSPSAAEICDSIDNDCDGLTDTEDSSLTDATAYYADTDSDGYGDATVQVDACSQPSGFVTDDTDCDDGQTAINPAATEVCNGEDDDCDGLTDDDDPSVTGQTTWYDDADGDGYGDASTSADACEQPSGTVTDDSDCDDSDDLSNPGEVELYDGADNDCDGTADDGLYRGTGGDGALTVTGTTTLSTDASGSRTTADAVAYGVTAISGSTVTLDATAAGLASGDEVLLINLQGSPSAHAAVGTHEFASVDTVSGSTVTLLQAVAETYGEASNTDLTDQVVVLQRVPHYTDVTVGSAGTLTTEAWDGGTGGVLAFRATGTVSVASGGTVTVSGLGYVGGDTGAALNDDAYQGESYLGLGDGGYNGGPYNEANGAYSANGGGGGANVTGGGGNHAGGATAGDSWNGGGYTAPAAGGTYGSAALDTLFFGSGGGGVWNGGTDTTGENPGPGGSGGGILVVGAATLDLDGAGGVAADGDATSRWASGTWTYGAAGGAGGSIHLLADAVDLAADSVVAEGGLGQASYIRAGGDGGVGRIRVDCTTCNGAVQGTATADSALDSACTPNPGANSTP